MARLKKILLISIVMILLFPTAAAATAEEETSLDTAGLAEEMDMDEFTAQLDKLDELLADEMCIRDSIWVWQKHFVINDRRFLSSR